MSRVEPYVVRHFCSAVSLAGWLGGFGGDGSTLNRRPLRHEIEVLAGHLDVNRALALVRRFPSADLTVIHSAHETLLRDAELTAELRRYAVPTFVLSAVAAEYGLDKLATRARLAKEGLRVAIRGSESDHRVLKSRAGTQGEGACLLAPGEQRTPEPDQFIEQFVHGVEYSVNVFRFAGRTVTFPVVWKGQTRMDLLPPFGRMRLCAPDRPDAQLRHTLVEQARAVAKALEVTGFAEVETVVPPDGDPVVLEVNPRISGTLRVSAMAAQFGFLDLFVREVAQRTIAIEPVLIGAELPYDGEPFSDVANGVVATSRLTVTASSETAALSRLAALASGRQSGQAASTHGAR
jgi:predicted ATP-grasp superfamily ATP-dependent carboligase